MVSQALTTARPSGETLSLREDNALSFARVREGFRVVRDGPAFPQAELEIAGIVIAALGLLPFLKREPGGIERMYSAAAPGFLTKD